MKLKIIGLSIVAASALSSAFLLNAAAPTRDGELRVDITAPADRSQQRWNSQLFYSVTASYDGKSTKFDELPANDVVVRESYVGDVDAPSARHASPLPEALVQISQSNCTGCHDFTASSAAPSFSAISRRYAGKANLSAILASHIRNGSSGTWGRSTMPPHPQLTPSEASAIAQWILSAGNDPAVHYSVGKSGSLRMAATAKADPHAGVMLSAFYTGPLKPGDLRAAEGRTVVIVQGSGS